MLIQLHIYEVQATEFSRGYFVAESQQLPVRSSCLELKGKMAEFFGGTKAEVIAEAKLYAKSLYEKGSIRLI